MSKNALKQHREPFTEVPGVSLSYLVHGHRRKGSSLRWANCIGLVHATPFQNPDIALLQDPTS